MSALPKDGGPAFPTVVHGMTAFSGQPTIDTYEGMTLRDWFAGQALCGMLSAGIPVTINGAKMHHEETAYAIADAMLAQRSKT